MLGRLQESAHPLHDSCPEETQPSKKMARQMGPWVKLNQIKEVSVPPSGVAFHREPESYLN
jgi:hypothetical protein